MVLPYVPVSCEVYDTLEDCAVRRRQCDIFYRDDAGQTVTIRDRIVSLSIQDKAEYVCLESGACVRLDALIELNGMPLPANNHRQPDISGVINNE